MTNAMSATQWRWQNLKYFRHLKRKSPFCCVSHVATAWLTVKMILPSQKQPRHALILDRIILIRKWIAMEERWILIFHYWCLKTDWAKNENTPASSTLSVESILGLHKFRPCKAYACLRFFIWTSQDWFTDVIQLSDQSVRCFHAFIRKMTSVFNSTGAIPSWSSWICTIDFTNNIITACMTLCKFNDVQVHHQFLACQNTRIFGPIKV